MDVGMNVLVVDYFAALRRIVRVLLKEVGFENVVEAGSEKAALLELRRRQVGLIVSDWNIPDAGGFEFLKAVRADEQLKKIPFIMVTDKEREESMAEAVKAGMSNYIVKPFAPATLRRNLEAVLG